MARKLILDVDTGTDDAVAVMLAALHPALDLIGCTTVNGNIPVQSCTDNTLRVLDQIGRSGIPVYEGLSRPLVRLDFPVPRRERDHSGKYHLDALPVPPPISEKQEVGAVEFLIETYRAATQEIVLVPVGPLTNIAAALALDAGFAERVPEIVIMGGAPPRSATCTAAAEFNIWADPEAAAMVFGASFADTRAGAAGRHAPRADAREDCRRGTGGARHRRPASAAARVHWRPDRPVHDAQPEAGGAAFDAGARRARQWRS